MRILLTGANGQVGSALLAPLQGLGTVIATDRSSLDLCRLDAIADVLGGAAPELIVNAAAYTAVDRAEDERDLAYLINADAPARIAHWAATQRVPLIHFSTDYVFDGTGTRPWREDDKCGPLSVYGASKLAGETAIRSASGPHLIVRTSWVYSPRGTNFLNTILRLARERKELRIVADQFGAPTSARAIAVALSKMLALQGPGLAIRFTRSGGIVHLACAGETSWHGFASAAVNGFKARRLNLAVETIEPIRTEDFPAKARRPKNSRLDLTRLKEVFGVATPDWREALDAELDALVGEHAEQRP